MTLIRTLRDDPTPEVASFVRFLIVSMPQPMVLPMFQPHLVSPFATFSNPPFFGEVLSPSAGTEGGEEYFDAMDVYEEMADEETIEAHGVHEVRSFEAGSVLPAELPAPASDSPPPSNSVTPQPPGDDDPVPARIERPPIYRVWSY